MRLVVLFWESKSFLEWPVLWVLREADLFSDLFMYNYRTV